MNQDNYNDYIWVVVERKKPKSCRRKMSSPNLPQIKIKNKMKKDKQDDEQIKRLAELERQNRILQRQNEALRQYFYITQKNENKNSEKQGKKKTDTVKIDKKQSRIRDSNITFRSQQKDRGELTTVNSQSKLRKNYKVFGTSKK